MLKLKIITFCVLLSSCCGLHTEVKYEYNDIVITRIDECGKTSFYYKNQENQDGGMIWAEYSGLNDGFDGYLQFDEKGKAKIIAGDGYFKSKNLDLRFFELDTSFSYS